MVAPYRATGVYLYVTSRGKFDAWPAGSPLNQAAALRDKEEKQMACQIDDVTSVAQRMLDYDNHEQVVRVRDGSSGLHAIIAVHSTSRGPAVGGCRVWQYPDESQAMTDALRLSAGMTYKNALAELPFGGGKAVIFESKHTPTNRTAMMEAFGRAVESLDGVYYTAEDVGTTCGDMAVIHQHTSYIFGLADTSGDPSPFTAMGVFLGIRAAVAHRLSADDLAGVHVVVQGVGSVGYNLCQLLHEAGAKLTVSDTNADAVERCRTAFDAAVVAPDEVYDVSADVYAPCALGATINEATLERMRVKVIAGAANNQLSDESLAGTLARRGILYAPDFAINAGGIINIACETGGYSRESALREVSRIGPRLEAIFDRADFEKCSPHEVAHTMVRERFSMGSEKLGCHATPPFTIGA